MVRGQMACLMCHGVLVDHWCGRKFRFDLIEGGYGVHFKSISVLSECVVPPCHQTVGLFRVRESLPPVSEFGSRREPPSFY